MVAIGETGFDHYYRPKTKTKIEEFKEKQKKALLGQLNLAKELSLPVIFHCRMGHQDLIEELSNFKGIKVSLPGTECSYTPESIVSKHITYFM